MWAYQVGATRVMPNFSHGTAGVAYALATLATRTGESAHIDAAHSGVQYLMGVADTSAGFRVFYDNIIDPPIYYLGWCHGPVGTARLFLRYHALDPGGGWDRLALDCASAVIASGIDAGPTPGFWNNLGVCCGNAGVAMFFLRLGRRTGRREFAAYARRHAAVVASRAACDDAGCRWTFAEHRRRPDELSTQTGLMQGAAGIGLLELSLAADERGDEQPATLPDDPL
jgi:lantibiotic modifying enzyme